MLVSLERGLEREREKRIKFRKEDLNEMYSM
jgi:hypothetical protein